VKEINPVKLAVSCVLFLATLIFTSGLLDVSIAVFLVSFSLSHLLPSPVLFLSSFLYFAIYLTFKFINLRDLTNLSDFSVPAYLLFVGGLVLYFLEGQKSRWKLKLLVKSWDITALDLAKIGGILLFMFMAMPSMDSYLTLVAGYVAFMILFKKFDGRYAVSIALYFLILCPFLLIAKKDKSAEVSAIFTYYFLVIGVFQEIVQYFMLSPEEKAEMEEEFDLPDPEEKEKPSRSFSGLVALLKFFPKPSTTETIFGLGSSDIERRTDSYMVQRSNILFPLIFGLVSFSVSGVLFFLIFTGVGSKRLSLPSVKIILPRVSWGVSLPKISFPKIGLSKINLFTTKSTVRKYVVTPTTTVTPSPTIIPVEDIASRAASLSVMVLNGTNTAGEAGKAAVKLKAGGFKDVKTGNADRTDYEYTQIILREENERLIEYVHEKLGLENLEVKDASPEAKTDVTVIIGKDK